MTTPTGSTDEAWSTFFRWLRKETEVKWSQIHDEDSGDVGVFWSSGTRWCEPLTDETIDSVQRALGCSLPRPYVLFLKELHATTPLRSIDLASGEPVVSVAPGFINWCHDVAVAMERLDQVRSGIEHDIREHRFWLPHWGSEKESIDERLKIFRDVAAKAPKLVPLMGTRFLVVLDDLDLSPVISVRYTDIILYGDNLGEYLIKECEIEAPPDIIPMITRTPRIPFWDDFLAHDNDEGPAH